MAYGALYPDVQLWYVVLLYWVVALTGDGTSINKAARRVASPTA